MEPQTKDSASFRFDKITLMRFLDIYVGSTLCYLFSLFVRKNALPLTPKKILLIKFFGFGNIIMISPVFRQIKERFPQAELLFLTLKNNTKLVSQYKIINQVISIDISNIFLIPVRIIQALLQLRKENIDIVIDFEQFSRTAALISFLGGRKYAVGFDLDKYPRRLLYTETIPCLDTEHAIIQFQKLLSFLDISPLLPQKIFLEKIQYSSKDSAFVDSLLTTVTQPIVVFHVGNGPNAPEKRWGIEKFASLAEGLHKKGVVVALIGSLQDKNEIDAFKRLYKGDHLDFFNQLTISQLAYFLTQAHAYVSADTGPAHLAAAMGVPSVILYGPTSPSVYGAWGPQVHYIYKKLWCSPCASNKNSKEIVCINKIYDTCMKDISVEEVAAKLLEVMQPKKQ